MTNGGSDRRSPLPGPGDGSLAMLLVLVGRRLRDQLERGLSADGVSLRYLSALGHLAHETGLSYSELARRSGVSAQSMQATLSQLQDLGAVRRITPSGRGRTAELQVTEVGTAMIRRGHRVIAAADQRLASAVSADQRDDLAVALLALLAGP